MHFMHFEGEHEKWGKLARWAVISHQSSGTADHQPTSDQPPPAADEDESKQQRRYSQINCEIINSFCWHTSLSRKGDDLAVWVIAILFV